MTTLDQVRDLSIKSDFEAFDVVARHLISQKEKCFGHYGDCGYRGYDESVSYDPEVEEFLFDSDESNPNGKSCAVGILIKEEFYDPEIEGSGINDGGVKDTINSSHPDWKLDEVSLSLLTSLQFIHDRNNPQDWPGYLLSLVDFFYEGDDGEYCLREEIPWNYFSDPKFKLESFSSLSFDADSAKLLTILDDMKGVK